MDYNKTFTKRYHSYMYAMQTYPNVLQKEFQIAVEELDLQPTDILLNIPASCVSLASYYTVQPEQVYEFETNEEFAKATNIPFCSFFNIPLPDKSVTKIISLASLHHMSEEERILFYKECYRLLKPGGTFVIGDVQKDSPQAFWLNSFVNQYNSSGHKGVFWDEEDCFLLEKEGFETKIVTRDYLWNFSSKEEMIDFSKYLFGLDLADSETIEKGIAEYLGLDFHWRLVYLHNHKVPSSFSIKSG
jgi:SAM-dependent methyltransferase